LARERGLRLILDAAQASTSKVGGLPIVRRGDAAVVRLAHGVGAAIALTDAAAAARAASARASSDGDPTVRVLEVMPDELMAVIGLASLRRAPALRQARARMYTALRAELEAIPGVALQRESSGCEAGWEALGVRIVAADFGAPRSAVRRSLDGAGIATESPFDPPLHRRRLFVASRARSGPLPVADRLAAESFVIPLDRLRPDDVERVAACFSTDSHRSR
jgi:dTDP-4-amino-4,6-dideoxygalactose transaminase